MLTDQDRVHRTLFLHDKNAYNDLVRKYQVEIRTYLTRLIRNREWADDVAQETFLKGYRLLAQLQEAAKFRSWIYSIAHTEFLQWYRKNKEREVTLSSDTSELSVSARAEVNSLLKTLRPIECSAIVLCLGHEFTHSEAAEILKMPLGTVKSLILRAKEKLGESHG